MLGKPNTSSRILQLGWPRRGLKGDGAKPGYTADIEREALRMTLDELADRPQTPTSSNAAYFYGKTVVRVTGAFFGYCTLT